MAGNVWVVAEQWKGSISDVTYEALALGRELAGGLGVRLEAVLLGHGARALAASLGRADGVLYVDAPGAGRRAPASRSSRALAALAAERARPWCWSPPPTSAGTCSGCCRRAWAPRW